MITYGQAPLSNIQCGTRVIYRISDRYELTLHDEASLKQAVRAAPNAPTSTPIVSRLPDADRQAVPAALARAAESARDLAARTSTPMVVTGDGKLMEAAVQSENITPSHGVPPVH